MSAQDFDPRKLDVDVFAKAGATIQGVWPLAELERLASSAATGVTVGEVVWSAEGEQRAVRGGPPQIWLHVNASACLMLECQRCLAPVSVDVDAGRAFMFVHGENTAAELDSDTEDDVLALTRSLDLRALIEDELLLELPLVPRHEACPSPLRLAEDAPAAQEQEPNPFAVLAALKRGSLPN